MDSKLRQELASKKVKEMIFPTIVMNDNDFTNFKKEVESKIQNFTLGDNPKYNGIPIKSSSIIRKGEIVIYDEFFKKLKL